MSSSVDIVLFCNLVYGRTFLELARARARRGGERWTVVLSGKGVRPGWKSALRTNWRRLRLALRTRLPVRVIADVNAPEFLASLPPRAHGLVAGFNQIFRRASIERFASLVNVHPSLLPYYRGPTPSHWVLERGERASGFTLHRVAEAIDAGEVLAQGVVPVGDTADARELDQRIAAAARSEVGRWLDQLESGAEWRATGVDAHAVYRHPVDYLSRPR